MNKHKDSFVPYRYSSSVRYVRGRALVRWLIPLAIVTVGLFVAYQVLNSAEKPSRQQPQQVARLVETTPIERQTLGPQWPTSGLVIPSAQTTIAPQVSGRIEWISEKVVPGQVFRKGDVLARLEATDLALLVQQRRAGLAQAEATLALEQAQARVAKEEYKLASSPITSGDLALVMREPQLASANAQVASAKAALEQAEVDLLRANVAMPFDGQLIDKHISIGSFVNAASPAFDVVAIDEFWIEVKVPRAFLDQLDMAGVAELSLPEWGSRTRKADILNALASVNAADRQVRIVLAIQNPLETNENTPTVLLNDFVDVRLPGKLLPDHFVIPRRWLVDDQYVWVVHNGKLRRRSVVVVYRGRDKVWISDGFESGDSLLISQMDAPVDGMSVRLEGLSSQPDSSQPDNLEPVGLEPDSLKRQE